MMSIIAPYGFVGDFFALILCLVCVSILRSSYTIKQTNLRLFYMALFVVACSSIQSIIYHAMLENPLTAGLQRFMFISFQNSVLIGLQVLLLIMLEYLMNLYSYQKRNKNIIRIWTWSVTAFYFLYRFYSPIRGGMDSYVDRETGIAYNIGLRDNLYIYVYAYLFTFCLVLVIYNRKLLIEHVYRCLLVNAIIPALIIAMSYFLNITSFLCISFMIPILAVLFLFHYNAYDIKTGTLDLKAFKSYIKDINEEKFAVLSLYLKKDVLDKNDHLAKSFAGYIRDTFGDRSKYCLFRVSSHHFILVYKTGHVSDDALGLIEMRVKYGLEWLYNKYGIPYQLLYIASQPELTSEDYIGLSQFLLRKTPLNTTKLCGTDDIANYKKYVIIESVFNEMQKNNNLDDERVFIHYQPIIGMNGECRKAEALMRVRINGKIYYPRDFIEMVEKENYSHFITKVILNKVCKDIKNLQEENYKFDKISINLSTEDLLINEGYKELIDIVENKHKLTFDKIAFEILENTDKVQYEPLVRAMTAFKSITNVEFYLDDFGSGYSNLLRLLSLPVDIIKFDRDVLKKIRQNSAVYPTVNTNVQTFLDAGYKVLFEGVEDEQDIETCQKMKINYYQGYAYAGPDILDTLKTHFKKLDE